MFDAMPDIFSALPEGIPEQREQHRVLFLREHVQFSVRKGHFHAVRSGTRQIGVAFHFQMDGKFSSQILFSARKFSGDSGMINAL